MNLWHWFVHRIGWNHGYVETWWEPCEGGKRLMVGFRCAKCGKISGVHESATQRGQMHP